MIQKLKLNLKTKIDSRIVVYPATIHAAIVVRYVMKDATFLELNSS
jgi:hypothetical protein